MIRLPKGRPPTHPGELLAEDFLKPNRISQAELARRIAVPLQRVNLLVNKKRGITPDTAIRLGKLFGTSPEFWLAGQLAWDLYRELHSPRSETIRRIRPLPHESLVDV